MPPVHPQQQLPRGPWSKLHRAAFLGSSERTVALLKSGSINIDRGDSKGITPLMFAALEGHSHVARILLNKGASVSVVGDGGCTALLIAAKHGHLAVTKMLVKAGADLDAATTSYGNTPLHLATERGHLEVVRELIEAGANPNSHKFDGSTPLFTAASRGNVDAIKMLLGAEANPLLTAHSPSGQTFVPLEAAATGGRTEAVRELMQQLGIEGCGGADRGLSALCVASGNQHVDTMAVLTDAGVIDTGAALSAAAECGREASVEFLLSKQQQQEGKTATAVEGPYVNPFDNYDRTPLLMAIGCIGLSSPSPRIVRMLVDAGADTTSAIRLAGDEGNVILDDTPLALTNRTLVEKKIKGEAATEEQLRRLETIRRLLLQVEAVHAVSWLWPSDVPCVAHVAEGTSRTKVTSAPLISMLPILRRRARRHGVLLATLNRYSGKIDRDRPAECEER